jgi:hypothetical protein
VFVERPVDRPVDQTIAATLPQATTPAGQSGSSGAMTGSTPKAPDGNRRPANTPHAERVARRPYVDDRPVQAASIDTVEAISVEPMTPVERLMPIDSIGLLPVARSEISLKPITIERIEITPLTPQR